MPPKLRLLSADDAAIMRKWLTNLRHSLRKRACRVFGHKTQKRVKGGGTMQLWACGRCHVATDGGSLGGFWHDWRRDLREHWGR